MGNSILEFDLKETDKLISDYIANIENLLNFDMKISKRVIIGKNDLIEYWNKTNDSNMEQRLICKKVIDIS
jgi:hypothetical protein